jgi:hypothetical protein
MLVRPCFGLYCIDRFPDPISRFGNGKRGDAALHYIKFATFTKPLSRKNVFIVALAQIAVGSA